MSNLLTQQDMIYLVLIVVGMAAAIVGIKLLTRKKKKDPVKEQKKIKTLERVYTILCNKKITRNYFIRATKKYGLLSVYTQSEIKCEVVKNFRNTVFATSITLAVAALVFREFSATVLCAIGAYVMFSVHADKKIEKDTTRVYAEFKNVISSLRIEYKKSKGDILVALEGATCGPKIAPSIDRIKHVLVAPNTEEELEMFYESTPFKQLQTLAMVCSNIYAHGDASVGGEQSVFDETMLLIEADVNQKLEEISLEKQLYALQIPLANTLEWLAALGVILTIVLKIMMIKIMPSTESVYKSIAGLLIQDACIGISIFAYNKVARAHLQQVILPDDRSGIVIGLMKFKPVRKFVAALGPKGQKRRILEYKLKVSVSRNTVDMLYCEKMALAAGLFLAVFGITFMAPKVEREFLQSYTSSFDLMADNSAYEDKDGHIIYEDDLINEMDSYYISQRKIGMWESKDEYDVAEIKALLLDYMPTLNTLQIEDQMTRLEEKYTRLQGVKYHFWYVFLAIAAGVIGFLYPNNKVKKRLELARSEEEEEFLQLQMITLILSSLNMDTLDTLGHLANVSEFHKRELMQCYYGYAANPTEALQALEDSIQSVNFKLFVGKLKETVENLSVKEVFADLRNDRAHICAERDTFIKNNIKTKRGKMGRMALMPMNVAIYGMMVFPLVYTGITGLIGTMDSITNM